MIMDDESGKKGVFTVLMTSLSVLLLAFFILLNSMATIDNHKIRAALGSLKGVFGVVEGGMGKLLGGRGPSGAGGVKAWTYESRYGLLEGEAMESLKELDEMIQDAGLGGQMEVTVTREGTHISLDGAALFESGSSVLTSQGLQVLAQIEKIIRATEAPVRIEGHTDNVPIHTETYPSNWELSTARAVNVLRYLIEERAIEAMRLSAEGFADTRPRVPNNTPENRAKNRRVTFVVLGRFI
jgi:chemotaxis protein MotB